MKNVAITHSQMINQSIRLMQMLVLSFTVVHRRAKWSSKLQTCISRKQVEWQYTLDMLRGICPIKEYYHQQSNYLHKANVT